MFILRERKSSFQSVSVSPSSLDSFFHCVHLSNYNTLQRPTFSGVSPHVSVRNNEFTQKIVNAEKFVLTQVLSRHSRRTSTQRKTLFRHQNTNTSTHLHMENYNMTGTYTYTQLLFKVTRNHPHTHTHTHRLSIAINCDVISHFPPSAASALLCP